MSTTTGREAEPAELRQRLAATSSNVSRVDSRDDLATSVEVLPSDDEVATDKDKSKSKTYGRTLDGTGMYSTTHIDVQLRCLIYLINLDANNGAASLHRPDDS